MKITTSLLAVLLISLSVNSQELNIDNYLIPTDNEEILPKDDSSYLNKSEHHSVIIYNFETKATTIKNVKLSTELDIDSKSIEPSQMNGNNTIRNNFTDLYLIQTPHEHPWRASCRAVAYFPGSEYYGSAILVDPKHVLLTAHQIYKHENNLGFLTGLGIQPGHSSDNPMPFGYFYTPYSVEDVLILPAWVNDGETDYDFALVRLTRPIGAITGFYPVQFNNDDAFFLNTVFNNPGYPNEDGTIYQNNEDMYNWFGSINSLTDETIRIHGKISYKGQSGGGLWADGNTYGVLSGWYGIPPLYSRVRFTRITPFKKQIIDWRISDVTPDEYDLMPLNVDIGYTNMLEVGNQFETISFLLHNYSSQSWSGILPIEIFLKSEIGNDFYVIYSFNYSGSLAAKETKIVSPPNMPIVPSIPEGSYYVGIQFDLNDYNPTNNTIIHTDDYALVWILPNQNHTSIAVTASISPNPAPPNSLVTISGSAIYNTGNPVTNGTVVISTSEDSWTTALNSNGTYSRIISAPASSEYVTVVVNDGSISGNNQTFLTVQGGGSGNGYTYDRSTICLDYQNNPPYNPIDETRWIRSNYNWVYCWTKINYVTTGVTFKWTWYEPNTNWGYSGEIEFDPPPAPLPYYDYLSPASRRKVSGSSVSSKKGRHQVDVFIKPEGGSFIYHDTQWWVMSFDFKENLMCKGIQNHNPVNPTNTFLQTDNVAWAWSRFTDVSESIELKTEWYEPNGSLFHSETYITDDPGIGYYYEWYKVYFPLDISGFPAANKCGNWTVKQYNKNPFGHWDLLYTDYFEIKESPNINPVVNISITPDPPMELKPVYVNVLGTDNTYINKVILYWNDGTTNSRTWDNINASTFNIQTNIGVFPAGQIVSVYARIFDNSGNHSLSPTQTITIPPLPPFNDCGDPFKDSDGNVYYTVLIGSQCWMKDNLSTTHYRNGVPIEYPGNDNDAWLNNINGAYAWYDNNIDWKNHYGALYNWNAVVNENGLCPDGWHIPSHDDWTKLEQFVCFNNGNSDCEAKFPYDNSTYGWFGTNEGNSLKSCRQSYTPLGVECKTTEHPFWLYNTSNFGTDDFGFSATPGGIRSNSTGTYYGLGGWGSWWTGSEILNKKWFRQLSGHLSGINRNNHTGSSSGYSVRCMKECGSIVITNDFIDITDSTAIVGGSVINEGCPPVTARGVIWGTIEYPTIDFNIGFTIDGAGLGEFTSIITGLDPDSTYYIRAYATNYSGTYYGDQLKTFKPCLGISSVTDIDGNKYYAVQIGEQCWMQSNLRTTHYRNGQPIPTGLSQEAWNNTSEGAYTIYDHTHWSASGLDSPEEMSEAYGNLYNWFAVSDVRGICPAGWTVPTNDDWVQLTDYVSSGWHFAGHQLKSCRQVNSPLGGYCNTDNHPRWNQTDCCVNTEIYGYPEDNYLMLEFANYNELCFTNSIDISVNYATISSVIFYSVFCWEQIDFPLDTITSYSIDAITFCNYPIIQWHIYLILEPVGDINDVAVSSVVSYNNNNICEFEWPFSKSTCLSQNYKVNYNNNKDVPTSALNSRFDQFPLYYATDEFSFSALPAGSLLFNYYGPYTLGEAALWWTSTMSNSSTAYSRSIDLNSFALFTDSRQFNSGFSVRCIRDQNVLNLPLEIHLLDHIIPSGHDTCFAAIETINVSDFVVQSDAQVRLIAGENILLQPLTQVESGAYLHAYIDLTETYCWQPENMLTPEEDLLLDPFLIDGKITSPIFRIYPNPTTGTFTLEMTDAKEPSTISVSIYGTIGVRILQTELYGKQSYEFDLSDYPKGIYLIRVINGDEIGVEKLIKQ